MLLDVSEMPLNESQMWFNKFWRKTVCILSDQKIVFINVISFRGCPFFHKWTIYVLKIGQKQH